MAKEDLNHWPNKQQAAALLGVAEKTIERMADRREIQKAMRKRPGLPPQVVFHPSDLERIKQARDAATPEAFVMPDEHTNGNGSNGNGSTGAVVPAGVRIGPEVIMGMFAQALQRQAQVSKLFLTVKEAAEYSGLPQATLRQLVTAGKLAAMKTGAGFRIRKADLEKL